MVNAISALSTVPATTVSELRSGTSSPDTRPAPHKSGAASGEAREPAPVLPVAPAGEAFAAALVAQHITPQSMTPGELQLRLGGGFQAPDTSLHLTDRRA